MTITKFRQSYITLEDLHDVFNAKIEGDPGTSGLAGEIALQLENAYDNSVMIIVTCPEEDYATEYAKQEALWGNRIAEWWYQIKFKYDKFLKRHTEQTADLSEAESSITTKNNDTPTDNGDYSTDPYTSSVVRTTQKTGLSGFDKYEQAKQVLITDTLDLIFADFEKNFVIRR